MVTTFSFTVIMKYDHSLAKKKGIENNGQYIILHKKYYYARDMHKCFIKKES